MRPVVIVIHSPSIHNVPRFSQAQEQLAVEALISQFAVEALHVAVFPRAARLDEQCLDLLTRQPLFDGLRGKLRPVVAANTLRPATDREKVLQHRDNIFAGKVASDLDRQAFSRVFIHHTKQA